MQNIRCETPLIIMMATHLYMLAVLIAILQAHTIFRLYLTEYWEGTHRLVVSGGLVASQVSCLLHQIHSVTSHSATAGSCIQNMFRGQKRSQPHFQPGNKITCWCLCTTVLFNCHCVTYSTQNIRPSLLLFPTKRFLHSSPQNFFGSDVILIFSSLHHKLEDSGVISG